MTPKAGKRRTGAEHTVDHRLRFIADGPRNSFSIQDSRTKVYTSDKNRVAINAFPVSSPTSRRRLETTAQHAMDNILAGACDCSFDEMSFGDSFASLTPHSKCTCLRHRWRSKASNISVEMLHKKLAKHRHCAKKSFTFTDISKSDCSPLVKEEPEHTGLRHCVLQDCEPILSGVCSSSLNQRRKLIPEAGLGVVHCPSSIDHQKQGLVDKNVFIDNTSSKSSDKTVTGSEIGFSLLNQRRQAATVAGCGIDQRPSLNDGQTEGLVDEITFVDNAPQSPTETEMGSDAVESSSQLRFEFDANPNLTLSLVSVLTSVVAEESPDLCLGDVLADQVVCLRSINSHKSQKAVADIETSTHSSTSEGLVNVRGVTPNSMGYFSKPSEASVKLDIIDETATHSIAGKGFVNMKKVTRKTNWLSKTSKVPVEADNPCNETTAHSKINESFVNERSGTPQVTYQFSRKPEEPIEADTPSMINELGAPSNNASEGFGSVRFVTSKPTDLFDYTSEMLVETNNAGKGALDLAGRTVVTNELTESGSAASLNLMSFSDHSAKSCSTGKLSDPLLGTSEEGCRITTKEALSEIGLEASLNTKSEGCRITLEEALREIGLHVSDELAFQHVPQYISEKLEERMQGQPVSSHQLESERVTDNKPSNEEVYRRQNAGQMFSLEEDSSELEAMGCGISENVNDGSSNLEVQEQFQESEGVSSVKGRPKHDQTAIVAEELIWRKDLEAFSQSKLDSPISKESVHVESGSHGHSKTSTHDNETVFISREAPANVDSKLDLCVADDVGNFVMDLVENVVNVALVPEEQKLLSGSKSSPVTPACLETCSRELLLEPKTENHVNDMNDVKIKPASSCRNLTENVPVGDYLQETQVGQQKVKDVFGCPKSVLHDITQNPLISERREKGDFCQEIASKMLEAVRVPVRAEGIVCSDSAHISAQQWHMESRNVEILTNNSLLTFESQSRSRFRRRVVDERAAAVRRILKTTSSISWNQDACRRRLTNGSDIMQAYFPSVKTVPELEPGKNVSLLRKRNKSFSTLEPSDGNCASKNSNETNVRERLSNRETTQLGSSVNFYLSLPSSTENLKYNERKSGEHRSRRLKKKENEAACMELFYEPAHSASLIEDILLEVLQNVLGIVEDKRYMNYDAQNYEKDLPLHLQHSLPLLYLEKSQQECEPISSSQCERAPSYTDVYHKQKEEGKKERHQQDTAAESKQEGMTGTTVVLAQHTKGKSKSKLPNVLEIVEDEMRGMSYKCQPEDCLFTNKQTSIQPEKFMDKSCHDSRLSVDYESSDLKSGSATKEGSTFTYIVGLGEKHRDFAPCLSDSSTLVKTSTSGVQRIKGDVSLKEISLSNVSGSSTSGKGYREPFGLTQGVPTSISSDTVLTHAQEAFKTNIQRQTTRNFSIDQNLKRLIVFYKWLFKTHTDMKVSTAGLICSEMSKTLVTELSQESLVEHSAIAPSYSDTSVEQQARPPLKTKSYLDQQHSLCPDSVLDCLMELKETLVALVASDGNTPKGAPCIAEHTPSHGTPKTSTDQHSGLPLAWNIVFSKSTKPASGHEDCSRYCRMQFDPSEHLMQIKLAATLLQRCTEMIVRRSCGSSINFVGNRENRSLTVPDYSPSLEQVLSKFGQEDSSKLLTQKDSDFGTPITETLVQNSPPLETQYCEIKQLQRSEQCEVSAEKQPEYLTQQPESVPLELVDSSSSDASQESSSTDKSVHSRKQKHFHIEVHIEENVDLSSQSSCTIRRDDGSPVDSSRDTSPERLPGYDVELSYSDDFTQEMRRRKESLELEQFQLLERTFLNDEEDKEKSYGFGSQYYDPRPVRPLAFPLPMEAIPEDEEGRDHLYRTKRHWLGSGTDLLAHVPETNLRRRMSSSLMDIDRRKKDLAAEFYSFDELDVSCSDSRLRTGSRVNVKQEDHSHGRSVHMCSGRESVLAEERGPCCQPCSGNKTQSLAVSMGGVPNSPDLSSASGCPSNKETQDTVDLEYRAEESIASGGENTLTDKLSLSQVSCAESCEGAEASDSPVESDSLSSRQEKHLKKNPNQTQISVLSWLWGKSRKQDQDENMTENDSPVSTSLTTDAQLEATKSVPSSSSLKHTDKDKKVSGSKTSAAVLTELPKPKPRRHTPKVVSSEDEAVANDSLMVKYHKYNKTLDKEVIENAYPSSAKKQHKSKRNPHLTNESTVAKALSPVAPFLDETLSKFSTPIPLAKPWSVVVSCNDSFSLNEKDNSAADSVMVINPLPANPTLSKTKTNRDCSSSTSSSLGKMDDGQISVDAHEIHDKSPPANKAPKNQVSVSIQEIHDKSPPAKKAPKNQGLGSKLKGTEASVVKDKAQTVSPSKAFPQCISPRRTSPIPSARTKFMIANVKRPTAQDTEGTNEDGSAITGSETSKKCDISNKNVATAYTVRPKSSHTGKRRKEPSSSQKSEEICCSPPSKKPRLLSFTLGRTFSPMDNHSASALDTENETKTKRKAVNSETGSEPIDKRKSVNLDTEREPKTKRKAVNSGTESEPSDKRKAVNSDTKSQPVDKTVKLKTESSLKVKRKSVDLDPESKPAGKRESETETLGKLKKGADAKNSHVAALSPESVYNHAWKVKKIDAQGPTKKTMHSHLPVPLKELQVLVTNLEKPGKTRAPVMTKKCQEESSVPPVDVEPRYPGSTMVGALARQLILDHGSCITEIASNDVQKSPESPDITPAGASNQDCINHLQEKINKSPESPDIAPAGASNEDCINHLQRKIQKSPESPDIALAGTSNQDCFNHMQQKIQKSTESSDITPAGASNQDCTNHMQQKIQKPTESSDITPAGASNQDCTNHMQQKIQKSPESHDITLACASNQDCKSHLQRKTEIAAEKVINDSCTSVLQIISHNMISSGTSVRETTSSESDTLKFKRKKTVKFKHVKPSSPEKVSSDEEVVHKKKEPLCEDAEKISNLQASPESSDSSSTSSASEEEGLRPSITLHGKLLRLLSAAFSSEGSPQTSAESFRGGTNNFGDKKPCGERQRSLTPIPGVNKEDCPIIGIEASESWIKKDCGRTVKTSPTKKRDHRVLVVAELHPYLHRQTAVGSKASETKGSDEKDGNHVEDVSTTKESHNREMVKNLDPQSNSPDEKDGHYLKDVSTTKKSHSNEMVKNLDPQSNSPDEKDGHHLENVSPTRNNEANGVAHNLDHGSNNPIEKTGQHVGSSSPSNNKQENGVMPKAERESPIPVPSDSSQSFQSYHTCKSLLFHEEAKSSSSVESNVVSFKRVSSSGDDRSVGKKTKIRKRQQKKPDTTSGDNDSSVHASTVSSSSSETSSASSKLSSKVLKKNTRGRLGTSESDNSAPTAASQKHTSSKASKKKPCEKRGTSDVSVPTAASLKHTSSKSSSTMSKKNTREKRGTSDVSVSTTASSRHPHRSRGALKHKPRVLSKQRAKTRSASRQGRAQTSSSDSSTESSSDDERASRRTASNAARKRSHAKSKSPKPGRQSFGNTNNSEKLQKKDSRPSR